MFCSQCGSQLPEGSASCSKCGWRVGSPVVAALKQPSNWVSPYDSPKPLQPMPISSSEPDLAMKVLLPVGRSISAIAAGYLGLLSLLILPAPFSILLGVLALREIKKDPKLGGRGRAIFGIVMGIVGIVYLPVLIVILATSH